MDVTNSLSQAWQHMKRVLFPFDFNKWLCLGLIVFFETLFEGGGGVGGSGGGNGSDNGGSTDIADNVIRAKDWVMQNLDILVPVAVALVVVILALLIFFVWLRSHGTMMFILAVAQDDARVGHNWNETSQSALSLFRFRLVLVGAAFLAFALTLAAATARVVEEAVRGTREVWPYVIHLLPVVLLVMSMGLTYWLVETLLRNFVAPLMYRSRRSCLDAWREFGRVCHGNVPMVVVFLFIRFAYFIPFGIATLISGFCTCCVGWLPVVHHTLFAPFYVFDRAYSLYVIESLGPEYLLVPRKPSGQQVEGCAGLR